MMRLARVTFSYLFMSFCSWTLLNCKSTFFKSGIQFNKIGKKMILWASLIAEIVPSGTYTLKFDRSKRVTVYNLNFSKHKLERKDKIQLFWCYIDKNRVMIPCKTGQLTRTNRYRIGTGRVDQFWDEPNWNYQNGYLVSSRTTI